MASSDFGIWGLEVNGLGGQGLSGRSFGLRLFAGVHSKQVLEGSLSEGLKSS